VTLSWSDTTWFPVFLRSRDSLLQLKLTQQVLSNPSLAAPLRMELVLTCMVQLLQAPLTYPEPHSTVEDCHAMAVVAEMRKVTFPLTLSVANPVIAWSGLLPESSGIISVRIRTVNITERTNKATKDRGAGAMRRFLALRALISLW